ncbi:MAG: VWA domain-containing protein [Anaerolineae bacterium]|nr:VWA domain-containing protein [Anaerolineae bacterium]
MKASRLFSFIGAALMLLVATATIFTSPAPSYAQQPFRSGVYLKSHRVSVTIDNQVAVTKIEQVFVNGGSGLAEGQYLFPLPPGAAVSDLTLYIDGQAFKPQLLSAGQAQQIYTQIVRQRRDPVLLQYVGRDAIQANIFPIPAGQERKIEITYSSVVTGDNGLFNYLYPLKTDYATTLPVEQVSLSVNLTSKDPISTIYSPNPLVIISRLDEHTVRAGFEVTNYRATEDFALYYGVPNNDITANLLTYRAGANEDGYFMLMLTPPTNIDATRVIPKDVIVVLDQSGSMQGDKWTQARAAAEYVLNNLNPQDRFNAIVFSTGYRLYANTMQSKSEAPNAARWINGLDALGGTDINLALTTAAQMSDPERQTILLFLTDGLPSEGVTDAKSILANLEASAKPNLRLFAFGVGDDVDTYLLDSLSTKYGGTSVYVRPQENIEQKVSTLYNKITSPVLTDLKLDFGTVMADDYYPTAPLPDLFAGSQLIVVGRYRAGGLSKITLTGLLNGAPQTYIYEGLKFTDNAGGQPFIPRLWATRKIGVLLNQIRLNGETKELVDSVVQLSVRYGIITPYTSFLIQENDIVARNDGGGIPGTPLPPSFASTRVAMMPTMTAMPTAGAAAVDKASENNNLAASDSGMLAPTLTAVPASAPSQGGQPPAEEKGSGRSNEPIKQVNDRTFFLRAGVWIDALYDPNTMQKVSIDFLSDAYFKLLDEHPEIKDYLAIGDKVIVVVGNVAYEVK